MSVFKRGFNKVDRRVVLEGITAAVSFDIPAGAFVSRVYAQNRSTTATNLTVGNVAAGAQYLASVAVPVATAASGSTPVLPGVLAPRDAIAVAVSKTVSNVHVTLSAYPTLPALGLQGSPRGLVDVVIEFEELWDSLPIPTQHTPIAY